MKLVNRDTFLTLPSGTVYAKYENCVFDDISIKLRTISSNDWEYISLDTVSFIDSDDSNNLYSELSDMQVGDSIGSINMDSSYRDGLFEEQQLFMVYSKNDVKKIIDLLKKTLMG